MRVITLLCFCLALLLVIDAQSSSSNIFVAARKRGAKPKSDKWYSVTDVATGRKYFWNKATGETTWTRPQKTTVQPGIKYHAQKNSRKNAKIGKPPPELAAQKGREPPANKRPQNTEKTSKKQAEAEQYELYDSEGDEIPPPPPAVPYLLIGLGLGALLIVVAVLVSNSRKDAALVNKIYKQN